MDLKLGKAPPKRYYADVAIHAEDYINLTKLPAPPKTLPSIGRGIDYGMFLNDRYGDCTIASISHMVQTHSKLEGDAVRPTDTEVMGLFHSTGVDEGLSDNDGRVMLDVLKYLKTTGYHIGSSTNKILGYAAVDPTDYELVRACTWLFGGLYGGYALPLSAQAQVGATWKVVAGPSGAPGSWGGHAIFNTVPGTCITWSQRQSMTWSWHKAYCDEKYAVLTPWWVENTKAPNGFARDELIRDLSQI